MIQKILDDGRRAFGYRWTVVLHDTEQRRHWIERVVRWVTLEELDDDASHTPDVGSRRRSRLLNHLGRH